MNSIEKQMIDKFQDIDYSIDRQDGDLTPIQMFYRNTKIFITGSTGFLGIILIEKLLRSCPDCSLYLLIRPKKGKTMETRFDELFEQDVFQRMKNHCPTFRERLVGIEGDLTKPNLGLSPENIKLLAKEIHIVFHVAATVRFDEKLKTAVPINICATQDLIRLARQMPKLKSLVHVSTAYCNCIHDVMEEKIYPSTVDYKLLISMTENLPDNILENITPGLLGKYPNTYTFTKQIAEQVVKQECEDIPVAIYRPAIVISTYREPIRGWINNIYGPTGVVTGAGVGLLRVLHCNGQVNANLVPVDMCVNGLIIVACEVGKAFENTRNDRLNYEIPVYNFESSNDKPINWKLFMDLSCKYGLQVPTMKSVWYYSLRLCKFYPVYLLLTFLLHTLPGFIVDGILLCTGKSPRMTRAYSKIHKFSMVIAYFATKQWTLKSGNLKKLITTMSDRDRKIFFCDLKQINWDEYFQTYTLGGRIYLIKDDMNTLPEAKKKWDRFYWAHQAVKAVLGILLLWLIRLVFSSIFKLF